MSLHGFMGGQAHICVQACGMLPQENFDFGPFFRHNLVESGTVFAQTKFTIYLSLYIIDLHIKTKSHHIQGGGTSHSQGGGGGGGGGG